MIVNVIVIAITMIIVVATWIVTTASDWTRLCPPAEDGRRNTVGVPTVCQCLVARVPRRAEMNNGLAAGDVGPITPGLGCDGVALP